MDTNVDSKEYEEHEVLFNGEGDTKSHERRMQVNTSERAS